MTFRVLVVFGFGAFCAAADVVNVECPKSVDISEGKIAFDFSLKRVQVVDGESVDLICATNKIRAESVKKEYLTSQEFLYEKSFEIATQNQLDKKCLVINKVKFK